MAVETTLSFWNSTKQAYAQGKENIKNYGSDGNLGTIGSFAGQFYNPTVTNDLNYNLLESNNIKQLMVQTGLSSGNPYLMAGAAAYAVTDKLGGTTSASDGLGDRYDTSNKLASIFLPGAGWLVDKTSNYKMSESMKQMNSGYRQSYTNAQTAEKNANSKLLWGRSKALDIINRARQDDKNISQIRLNTLENNQAILALTPVMAQRTSYEQNGGYQQGLARAAKDGAKLEFEFDIDFKDGKDFFENLILEETLFLKEGGEFNVIPEGALHAHKHHMEDDKHITKKGVPVIDKDGHQQAEIERNEIIFRLEVTKKLEELWSKFKEDKDDKFAIEAGKILTCEIMENTQDRTGLINEIN